MEPTLASAGPAAAAVARSRRFAVVLDVDRPQLVHAPLAAFGGVVAHADPIELAFVVRGGFEANAPELVTSVVQQLCREHGIVGQVVAYEPHEAQALDLDGVAGVAEDDEARAAELARWLARLAAVHGELHDSDPCAAEEVHGLRLAAAAREDLTRVFSDIYRTDAWSADHDGHQVAGVPRSGPGSLVERSLPVMAFLRERIASGEVRSVADIGCGDLTYIAAVPEIVSGAVAYYGYEIVPSLVEEHRRLPWGEFHVGDLTAPDFGVEADLVIVKDVLFHLSSEHIHAALANIEASTWRRLVVTSYPGATNENRTLDQWHFARVDLEAAPFGLRPALTLPRDDGVFLVLERS
ncbi:MAG: hypothetical protein JWQ48_4016 [Conexibacter sp.]|nr:hypothetical protein [Conexibacter sp.]